MARAWLLCACLCALASTCTGCLDIEGTQEQKCDAARHNYDNPDPACANRIGLIPYTPIFYCDFKGSLLALIPMTLWAIFLGYMVVSTAERFMSPALYSISQVFKVSNHLTGVLFLALGNASPAVFTATSSIAHGAPQLGFSIIIGTGIVLAMPTMAAMAFFKRSSTVMRRPFLRDSLFYWLSLIAIWSLLIVTNLHIIASICVFTAYIIYVVAVIVGRYLIHRRADKRKQRSARGGYDSTLLHEARESGHLSTNACPGDTEESGVTDYGTGGAASPGNGDDEEYIEADRFPFLDELTFASNFRSLQSKRFTPTQADYYHGRLTFSDTEQTVTHKWQATIKLQWSKFLDLIGWYQLRPWQKGFFIVLAPSILVRQLSIPPLTLGTPNVSPHVSTHASLREERMNEGQPTVARYTITACCVTSPLLVFVSTRQYAASIRITDDFNFPVWALVLCCGLVLAPVVFYLCNPAFKNTYYKHFGGLAAFFMSGIWLYLIACEFACVIRTLGLVAGVSDTIIGLTVVSWGVASLDLVADVLVAHQGLLDMAVGAAFNSGTITVAFSVGIGCTTYAIRYNLDKGFMHMITRGTTAK
eukprot:TRINITY_DN3219_c0_g1_i2.p1 TRINITY_DN3219_c0_g1~~TRINITY_DN3219_c0_g1_i2.p1  ORF type:complete len:589 (-),score=117.64 TRINITY_DN3219_c0_g1_i2:331-2097(-)